MWGPLLRYAASPVVLQGCGFVGQFSSRAKPPFKRASYVLHSSQQSTDASSGSKVCQRGKWVICHVGKHWLSCTREPFLIFSFLKNDLYYYHNKTRKEKTEKIEVSWHFHRDLRADRPIKIYFLFRLFFSNNRPKKQIHSLWFK